MKFVVSSADEWESSDWRWTVRKIEQDEYALYDNADEVGFVGDFPSLDLAQRYAHHVNDHEAATMSMNA